MWLSKTLQRDPRKRLTMRAAHDHNVSSHIIIYVNLVYFWKLTNKTFQWLKRPNENVTAGNNHRRSTSPGRAPLPGLPTPKVSSPKSSSNPQPSSPVAIIDPNVRREHRSSASESRPLQNTVRTNEQISSSNLRERQNITNPSTSDTNEKYTLVLRRVRKENRPPRR